MAPVWDKDQAPSNNPMSRSVVPVNKARDGAFKGVPGPSLPSVTLQPSHPIQVPFIMQLSLLLLAAMVGLGAASFASFGGAGNILADLLKARRERRESATMTPDIEGWRRGMICYLGEVPIPNYPTPTHLNKE